MNNVEKLKRRRNRLRLRPGERKAVARMERETAAGKRRRQIARAKRGEPANPPKPKRIADMPREKRIAYHREQIRTLTGILEDMPRGHGRNVMENSLEGNRRELRELLGVPKPKDKYASMNHAGRMEIR
jgi:hypothetical protein